MFQNYSNIIFNLGRVQIKIPRIIDDYNQWMGGVDQADQMIAYYMPDMRCHRTWLPMFLHLLAIIRLNSYIVYKHCSSDSRIKSDHYTGKIFTMDFITALMDRAEGYYGQKTPYNQWCDSKNLPLSRFDKPLTMHQCIRISSNHVKRRCLWCMKLYHIQKQMGNNVSRPSQRSTICSHCQVTVCREHFDTFHQDD